MEIDANDIYTLRRLLGTDFRAQSSSDMEVRLRLKNVRL